jgi:hypothetical protein
MMVCEGCRFAEWRMTESGRKHPGGGGQCSWEKTFRIAGSARALGVYGVTGQPITISGAFICRKRGNEWPAKCDTFEPDA